MQKIKILMNLIREHKPYINFLSGIFLLKDGKALTISKSKSIDFYNCFVTLKVQPSNCLNRWLDQFRTANDNILKTMNLTNYRPRLLAFQFKIVHNIVNCASNLKKLGIRESNLCIYCKKSNLMLKIH